MMNRTYALLRNGEWFESIEIEGIVNPGRKVVGNLDRVYEVISVDDSDPTHFPKVEVRNVEAFDDQDQRFGDILLTHRQPSSYVRGRHSW